MKAIINWIILRSCWLPHTGAQIHSVKSGNLWLTEMVQELLLFTRMNFFLSFVIILTCHCKPLSLTVFPRILLLTCRLIRLTGMQCLLSVCMFPCLCVCVCVFDLNQLRALLPACLLLLLLPAEVVWSVLGPVPSLVLCWMVSTTLSIWCQRRSQLVPRPCFPTEPVSGGRKGVDRFHKVRGSGFHRGSTNMFSSGPSLITSRTRSYWNSFTENERNQWWNVPLQLTRGASQAFIFKNFIFTFYA